MIVPFQETTDVCTWKADQIKQRLPIFNIITKNVFEWKWRCVRDVFIGVVSVYSVSCQWNSFQITIIVSAKRQCPSCAFLHLFLIYLYLYKRYRPFLSFTVQKLWSLTLFQCENAHISQRSVTTGWVFDVKQWSVNNTTLGIFSQPLSTSKCAAFLA